MTPTPRSLLRPRDADALRATLRAVATEGDVPVLFGGEVHGDTLLLSEVYPAGEQPIAGADGRALARGIRARGKSQPIFVDSIGEVPDVLADVLQANDVLLTLGAGNVGSLPSVLMSQFGGAP